jgi:hypothetical protein
MATRPTAPALHHQPLKERRRSGAGGSTTYDRHHLAARSDGLHGLPGAGKVFDEQVRQHEKRRVVQLQWRWPQALCGLDLDVLAFADFVTLDDF